MEVDTQEQKILRYAEETFSAFPEYLFESSPDAAVLRRADSRKWFAILMTIPAAKLGLPGSDSVRIVNVKSDPNLIGSLRLSDGFYPAYHMNKESWITILLDGPVDFDQIAQLLMLSYDLVGKKRIKKTKTQTG